MIKEIINQLNQSDFYGVDEDIDIAKGLYSYPTRLSEFKERTRRIKSWLQK